MFFSRSLTETSIDFGLMGLIAQMGKNNVNDSSELYNLAIAWFIQSNILGRLVGRTSLYFSIITRIQSWALYPFGNPHWRGNSILLK